LAIEGGHLSDYDPVLRSKLQGEAARIIRAFGFAGAHVIIIGGLVPSLLVPNVEVGLEPHIGTTDLDLCLSVALVEGDIGAYEKLEKCLRDAGFDMARAEDGKPISWRWVGGKGAPVTVEFFCSMAEGRVSGRLHRPGGVVGGKLSALVLATGALIDRDFRTIELEVDLPEGCGRTKQEFRVAGPAAYLAAKADALRRRNKNKDAYDVVWISECWPGGQPALAAEIKKSSIYPDLTASLDILREEFASIDAAGAVKYGRFMATDSETQDAAARRAVGAIRTLLAALA
jgi:hypothetical protein